MEKIPLAGAADLIPGYAVRIEWIPEHAKNGWQTILIYTPYKKGYKRKTRGMRAFQVDWNGTRFARNRISHELERNHPLIYRWAVDYLATLSDETWILKQPVVRRIK